MPMFGNNQIDDPSCAGVTGRTCSLRTGVYLSGCLRDLVPLHGKGMRDQLPGGISGDSGGRVNTFVCWLILRLSFGTIRLCRGRL